MLGGKKIKQNIKTMKNNVTVADPILDNCPVCNTKAELVPTRQSNKVTICCTNKSCFMFAGTMAAWDDKFEAANAWNKKPTGYMKAFEDLPKWLQELWNVDKSLARKAEDYIKNILNK